MVLEALLIAVTLAKHLKFNGFKNFEGLGLEPLIQMSKVRHTVLVLADFVWAWEAPDPQAMLAFRRAGALLAATASQGTGSRRCRWALLVPACPRRGQPWS
jgi:hypothetical protein